MARPLTTRAPAKINLTLHVLGRRADGYHDLESLVAFAGIADTLTLEPGTKLGLHVSGPTASLAGNENDNLVLKAARFLSERIDGLGVGTFHLTKRLPVAAGVGGGSSDAAAALRLLARLNNLPLVHPAIREAARLTGADVSVCVEPRARMMRGIGADLSARVPLPRLFAVLVNPRIPVETPAVFSALGLQPGQSFGNTAHPVIEGVSLFEQLKRARNDLEGAALRVQPIIGDVLRVISETKGCVLARMSGSGATVFGLYADSTASASAGKTIQRARPDWWVKATSLR
ncbi:4-(cytidine 5'-diphospho)-2-C-methyl-D-erythritol kinase [Microvirga sp. 2MCAF38]|uniref:4-(cytidine 5'-diphospho)-2-C-methyl-D-erythritol kinase n=1 Tax=Microvirga sp. 2MCAF38 TaxID=3232989 RepID=UPI003F9CA6C6